MLPSIAQPVCRPKPMLTLKSSNVLRQGAFSSAPSKNADKLPICFISWMMRRKLYNAESYRSFFRSPPPPPATDAVSVSFQTSKKASPMFLLGAPPLLTTYLCVISAILFTKSITSSWSPSVAKVNSRMSQKPKMASILLPGTMGLSSPPSDRLLAMISAPADPNPICNSRAIFVMACSSMSVSDSPESMFFWFFSFSKCKSGFSLSCWTVCFIFSIGLIMML
mmetsp:Transcript_12334/g.22432  ORF Transcript_12334/g.22432 Transcript_12334/m.22432 type:complete len:223 (-) Transcript_12334:92-760(-)